MRYMFAHTRTLSTPCAAPCTIRFRHSTISKYPWSCCCLCDVSHQASASGIRHLASAVRHSVSSTLVVSSICCKLQESIRPGLAVSTAKSLLWDSQSAIEWSRSHWDSMRSKKKEEEKKQATVIGSCRVNGAEGIDLFWFIPMYLETSASIRVPDLALALVLAVTLTRAHLSGLPLSRLSPPEAHAKLVLISFFGTVSTSPCSLRERLSL